MKNKISRQQYIESIYHIVFYGNFVRDFNNTLLSIGDKINGHEKTIIRYSIQSNVMIATISLLDELNKYLFQYKSLEEDTNNKIDSYKYIIEPILDEIAKWTDFRNFRNNVLAHNFRIHKENSISVHLANRLSSYNIPNSIIDLVTLFKYLDAITKVAEEMFAGEYQEALNIIISNENGKRISQNLEEEFANTNIALAAVNERIKIYNLT